MRRHGAAAAATALVGTLLAAAPSVTANAARPQQPPPSCILGNGISHVIELTFDNVHFFRDNPNVPSDLEQMPALLNFIEGNGTMLSNNHTPLIAHTADDSLTNYTGLYGDRHGMGISNGYQYFNVTGTPTAAKSFVYWTDPVINNSGSVPSKTDPNPSMVYSADVPAKPVTPTASGVDAAAPAPWVPFTRDGCNFGAVSTANMVLESNGDITQVFGKSSAENAQLQADPTFFKDQESADYIGLSVHCGTGPAAALCADASAVKFGQTTLSPTAVPDLLPDEPGGYSGFQALHGHRYIAPVLGAGTPNLTRNGYQITNGAGNLVDLAGNQINGDFLSTPGFPGFGGISAAQSLAYVADMQESGVPVTYGYISDVHGNNGNAASCSSSGEPRGALGPGDTCYKDQAASYNDAFATFFQRLAADGITPANTLFVLTADEGDHFAGANVGRALTPSCTGTPGTTSSTCTYAPGTIGELGGNLTGLLASEASVTTSFKVESDSAPEFYIQGNPGPTAPTTRTLERSVASLQANNPYAGVSNTAGTGQTIANWLADPTEEAILHFVNADPMRTPSFALFAKPDYYLSTGPATCPAAPPSGQFPTGNPCVTVNPAFAWNHGDYAPEIDTTWLGMVGPGVPAKGVDGWGPTQGPSSAGPESGQGTIPAEQNPGTWADHTDIRPTILSLAGLRDDYVNDGRVLVEDLTPPATPTGLRGPFTVPLMGCYKQLDSSVGVFGTDTLAADTAAIRSGSGSDDSTYTAFLAGLGTLADQRDALATTIKDELATATNAHVPINPVVAQTELSACGAILNAAAAPGS